jgi:nitrate/nitrite transporter NarK
VLAVAAIPLLAVGPDDSGRERVPRTAVIADRRLLRLGIVHGATFGLSVIAGNWIVSLLTRGSGYGDERAGAVGSLVLAASLVTRPLGGELLRRRPGLGRTLLVSSLAAGAAGVAALAAVAPVPLGVALAASLAVGLAAGLPFAPVFGGAAATRPDAPGAAVGFVNAVAVLAILAGTPLAGLTFSLPGDGRIGFAAIAALWAAALLVLPQAPPSDETSSSSARSTEA